MPPGSVIPILDSSVIFKFGDDPIEATSVEIYTEGCEKIRPAVLACRKGFSKLKKNEF